MIDFKKTPPFNILTCPRCLSTGRIGFKKCPDCAGQAFGIFIRNKFLYWGFPLTRYHLQLSRARQVFNKIRRITLAVLILVLWFYAGYIIYGLDIGAFFWERGPFSTIGYLLNSAPYSARALFSLGLLVLLYLFYRTVKEDSEKDLVEQYAFEDSKYKKEDSLSWTNWKEIKRISKNKKKNVAACYDKDALLVVARAYKIADENHHAELGVAHIFAALLEVNRVASIFLRLGIPISKVRGALENILKKEKNIIDSASLGKISMPRVSSDVFQILFKSYEKAYEAHQDYVGVGEVMLSTVEEAEVLQEMLYDLGVNSEKLANVIEWVRMRERLYHNYVKFAKTAKRRSKHGMDKAMTAVATPYLNNFSEDLTHLSQMGYLDSTVGRDSEIKEIFRIVQAGGRNVLLVGDYGVGKLSVVEGIAEKMVLGDVPQKLFDKRLIRLSVSSLLAGTTPSGAVERLIRIMNEARRAGNIILFIHNIDELIGVSTGQAGGAGLDVSQSLTEYLNKGNFYTLATVSSEGYSKFIVNSAMAGVFTKVDINEMTENQAIQVLESKVGLVEHKHKVFFSYNALEKVVKLASRFIQDDYLPGSALEIMKESAAYTRNKKGENALVSEEEVAYVVAQKTKIPVQAVSSDESQKLLRLEDEMHKRVIGQDEAVDAVANALRRARAEIRSQNRPIANFLFLGPTGVGKTELAKTIADIYFGGEQNIVRLDMSEYQEKQSVYRLLGNPGAKGTGILTEAVRQKPFTLLLLDEIEKADSNVLNLFLQVMDDGRLTDSTGRTVDFTNVIIIATSNAGTTFVRDETHAGTPQALIMEKLLRGELASYFKPEFLNRFDGIILFKTLDHESIKKIAGLMLKRLEKDLDKRGVALEFDDAALEFLANVGYDPDFGARPMRRAIQEKVENKLAELILSGKLNRKDVVVIDGNGGVKVKGE